MNNVRFVIVQHVDIDPVTGTRYVQLHKFDVLRIAEDGEMAINNIPLHERAAERLRRRMYASLDST